LANTATLGGRAIDWLPAVVEQAEMLAYDRHVLRGVGATVKEATNAGSTPCYTLAASARRLMVRAAIVAERRK
jgi:hypothetical protein